MKVGRFPDVITATVISIVKISPSHSCSSCMLNQTETF